MKYGINPYLNFPVAVFPQGNVFYSGYIDVNPILNWNFNTNSLSIGSTELDFYTAMLHEAIHLLGFQSLLSNTGVSKFGTANNYFTKYDTYLTDASGNPVLTAPSVSCSSSNLTYALATTTVLGSTVGSTVDITVCANALKYVSTTNTGVAVFTPTYYLAESSFHHFEDMCSPPGFSTACTPTPSSPGFNDLYYVMSNSINLGSCYVKRFLKDEEKNVLCDLGYSVGTTYTSSSATNNTVVIDGTNSFKTYTSGACLPTMIYGANDGLLNGIYTFSTITTNTTITFAQLMSNDIPNTGLTPSCMEVISPGCTLTIGATDFNLSASIGAGLKVLKYYPKNSIGQLGNVTYVFVYFVTPGCSGTSECNLIRNSGFENLASGTCGPLNYFVLNPMVNLQCWETYQNNPSINVTGCISPVGNIYNLGTNTNNSIPPVSSYNGTVNTAAVGLKYLPHNATCEALKTNLGTQPLIAGQSYQISFWAINPASSATSYPYNDPTVISIASYPSYPATPTINFPTGLNVLADFTINPGNNWSYYTTTFAVPSVPSTGQNSFLIGINANLTSAIATNSSSLPYSTDCYIDDISILPYPGTQTFVIPSPTICASAAITNLAQYASTTGTFSGNGITTGTNNITNFNSPPNLPPGSYPIAFTYTSTGGCTNTIYEIVNISSNPAICCVNSQFAPVTPSVVSNGTAFTGPLLISQDVTVSATGLLTLYGEIRFASNVKVVVENGGGLTIANAHLLSCGTDMWDGIVVKDGGTITANGTGGSNLIEDAKIAIDVSNSTASSFVGNVLLYGTTFNKNYISLSISNYSLPPSSPQQVHISDCVFTCRDLPYTLTNWPQTGTVNTTATYSADLRAEISSINGLIPPFLSQTAFSITNLKNPYSSQSSQTAIQLINVGNTIGNTTNSVNIGHPFNPDFFNLFDAHNIGIYALNSNLASFNNIFQNAKNLSSPGVGIKAINNLSNGYVFNSFLTLNLPANLNTNNTPGISINRFYNCYTGIEAINQAWLYARYAEFKSTHTPSLTTIGVFGIYENSNRYLDHQVLDCKFLNLNTGIFCNYGINSIVETASPFGQLWGTYNVKRNLFAPTTQSTISNNEFLGTAVYFQNIINLNTPQAVTNPNVSYTTTGLNIMDNTFDRVYRGASVNNFGTDSHIKTTANNTITLVLDHYAFPQWGIYQSNNYHSIVNSNIVTGYTIGLGTSLRGIYQNDISLGASRCNSVVNLPVGMDFGGTNVGMIWRQNTMLTNSRGMQLSNTGTNGGIDQQGDPTNPSDNYWQSASSGDWTGRHHTWTDINSWAINSPLFVRAISGFTQTFNGSNGVASQKFIDGQTLHPSTSETIIPCYTLPEHEFDEDGISYQAMQIVLTGDPEEDEQEVSQYLLFFALDQDTNLVNSNDTLHEFYNSNISGALGEVKDIEDLLALGQYTDAFTAIDNFSPETNIETNYKAFFELYYSYITTTSLSTGALSDLEVLALQCPFKDGPAIYKARALYNLITKSVVIYDDEDCLSSGYSERPAKSDSTDIGLQTKLVEHEASQVKLKTKTSFKIYPNPAEDVFYINTKYASELLNVQIRDVSGRVLFSRAMTNSTNATAVEINLLNGIYFVTITAQDGFSQTKKLVISK